MKKIDTIITIIMVLIVISGTTALICINLGTQRNSPRTITDMAGREVKIPEEINRIVGIEAGALRLIVYLGASDRVVGVEEIEHTSNNTRPYIIAHPELQTLPSIGQYHGGDAELITAQQPDVIFWTFVEVGDADALQSKTGIPVVVLEYGDLEENKDTFYEALGLMGEILNLESRVLELKTFFDNIIGDLDNRTKDIPIGEKPSVYVGGVSYRGAHGITSTEVTYGPFLYINALNVASNLTGDHIFIDPEQLIEWNPDILIIDEGGYSLVKEDLQNTTALYNTLDAVKNNEMYCVLPYNQYTTNFGSILANAYYVGSVIFEEQFSDINPIEKTAEIYSYLVGIDVYQAMVEAFGGFKQLVL